MNDIVVDSSVVVKWILPEPDSALALRLTTEVPAAGGHLVVLDLVFPEVVNAIWKRHRQKLITLAEARPLSAFSRAFRSTSNPRFGFLAKHLRLASDMIAQSTTPYLLHWPTTCKSGA